MAFGKGGEESRKRQRGRQLKNTVDQGQKRDWRPEEKKHAPQNFGDNAIERESRWGGEGRTRA